MKSQETEARPDDMGLSAPATQQSALTRELLELQVRYLAKRLDDIESAERDARRHRREEDARWSMWGSALTPAIVVLLMFSAFVLSLTGMWDPFTDGSAKVNSVRIDLGRVGALIKDWSAIILPLTAAIALVLKRVANRSMFSVVALLLCGLLGVSTVGLEFIIQKDWYPSSDLLSDWHPWLILLALAVVGLLVLHLVAEAIDRFHDSGQSPPWIAGRMEHAREFVAGTRFGQLLGWIFRPFGWARWVVSLVIITGLPGVLSIGWLILGGIVYAFNSKLGDAINTPFVVVLLLLLPLGPLWWAGLAVMLGSRQAFRKPAATRASMLLFSAIGYGAAGLFLLALFLYGPSSGPNSGLEQGFLLAAGILSLLVLGFWLAWAALVAPLGLRQTYSPMVMAGVGVLFLPGRTTLPFVTMLAVLVLGIPVELWTSARRLMMAPLSASSELADLTSNQSGPGENRNHRVGG